MRDVRTMITFMKLTVCDTNRNVAVLLERMDNLEKEKEAKGKKPMKETCVYIYIYILFLTIIYIYIYTGV